MRFTKIVFLVAGIYGVLILTPIYFMEARIGRDTPPAITHPEYFYGFLGAGLAWQILFLVLSRDPLRYRAMILPSIVDWFRGLDICCAIHRSVFWDQALDRATGLT
jgi:hypothetical protein